MNITLYKVLDHNGKPMHGGSGCYPLPTADKPGKWMSPIKPLVSCHSGYHVCRGAEHLIHWLGPVIWGVETCGKVVEADNKVVCEQVRLVARVDTWNDRTARLFAADCAEHVLPLFEQQCPGDMRPRKAVEAARAYAREEINKMALAAARAAGDVAAADAARAAANAADAAWTAGNAAAWAAAAAADAAWAVARAAAAAASAARVAERKWQAERLRYYLSGKIMIDV